ncbi:MAG: alpha/beta hydrolase [Phycisphaerales bacterium]|nr:alpha/beta hydrolase [Phycisphaerales bacterium]
MHRTLAILPVILAVWLAGCAHEPRFPLVHEDTVQDLYALKCLSGSYENHTTLVPTHAGTGQEVGVAIHAIGDGTHGRTLVLIHGIFTDHSTWRFVQGLLARDYDLLVVDLPGCGDSDKPEPAPDAAADTVYTPPFVARRVLEALEAVLAGRPRAPLAIVGHSYGGLIAIRMFSDEGVRAAHADLLSRVDRLVLFSPVDAAINHPDPMFEQLASLTAFDVSAGVAFGMIQDVLAEATLRATAENSPALHEEYHKRLDIITDARARRALQAMVLNAVTWIHDKDAGFRPDWPAMEAITRGYARVDVPTLIIWGERDETLPVSMGYKLAAQLPSAKLVTVPGAMHSLQIERPRYAVELIEQFVGEPSMADRATADPSVEPAPAK